MHRIQTLTWTLLMGAAASLFGACQADPDPKDRVPGQTQFVSAPALNGQQFSREQAGSQPPTANTDSSRSGSPRAVEETDIYRLDGDRLYFLNGYRGLLVFDVSDVDHPVLLGRSPIFGWPVEMVVRNGQATVVVADWYGAMEDGSPFHGSIVRGLDVSDPADIRVLGEARLGGWVRDTRVVGDVLYAVSEDYGWYYGWGRGEAAVAVGATTAPTVIVSSVSFAGGQIQARTRLEYPGWGGVFHVTSRSILLAHAANPAAPAAQTELLYLDISDPTGTIEERGRVVVNGQVQGWGPDNGRWNLDFSDGRYARALGCAGAQWCDGSGYVLATADFADPDRPVLTSALSIPSSGWGVAARFAGDRLYLSPDSYTPLAGGLTPFEIYDLSNPAQPVRAGGIDIPGTVWNILLAPSDRVFALGNEWTSTSGQVSLKYLDASDPAAPRLIGTATFGQGWAWTPAAGTFKAFTLDAARGLVVLPFAGWDSNSYRYNNGLQLIELSANSIRAAGAASTKGWVERGIFVGNRLVSLSDTALAVIDYTNHDQPVVVRELTLARNVVSARPAGGTITLVSTDWWGNTQDSEIRVLPLAQAEELTDTSAAPTLSLAGVNARVFRNGALAYVVTNVSTQVDCATAGAAPRVGEPGAPCYQSTQRVAVVDTTGGTPVLRGSVDLPPSPYGYYGWWGWYDYGWYHGSDVVQVGSDALAFRRWLPVYDGNGYYIDANSALYVVDLANPDQPALASTTITTGDQGWWGNMKVVGNTLYVSHQEWVQRSNNPQDPWLVSYYLDRVDLTDRANPAVGSSVNVPGLLLGASPVDPALLYFMDYRWDGNSPENWVAVARLVGDTAQLVSTLEVGGYSGYGFVRGAQIYTTVHHYDATQGASSLELYVIDLTDPAVPVAHASAPAAGWGWLVGVEGDRALVSSGWSGQGLDVYRLVDGQAPEFLDTVRTRGWWFADLAREGNSLFVASGYWGVQRLELP